MGRTLWATLFSILSIVLSGSLYAQANPRSYPWWVGIEGGIGRINLHSKQTYRSDMLPLEKFDRKQNSAVFGLFGGYAPGNRIRLGMEIHMWILEAGNLNDPSVGEGVSTFSAIADMYPSSQIPIFVRGGLGIAMFKSGHTNQLNSHGFSQSVGLGYEFRLSKRCGLAPVLSYSRGGLGNALAIIESIDTGQSPTITMETGRSYSSIDLRTEFIYHFGKSRAD